MLAIVRPRCKGVVIDAYSDYRDALSPRAEDAQRLLRERGARRVGGLLRRPLDPGMAIELDPSDEADWTLLRDYASWSIHVEAHDGSQEQALAILHDCGESITGKLAEEEALLFTTETGLLLTPSGRWHDR